MPAGDSFDSVLVWKLDRWGRSVTDSIKDLNSLGVRFIAVTQNIDTDEANPMARFRLHVMACVRRTRTRAYPGARRGRGEGGQGERQAKRAAEARLPARR